MPHPPALTDEFVLRPAHDPPRRGRVGLVLRLTAVLAAVAVAAAAIVAAGAPRGGAQAAVLASGEDEAPPRKALTRPAITPKVQRALYSIDSEPRDGSAFAVTRSGAYTYLVTTYQLVLGGTIVVNDGDLSFPIHEIVTLRRGAKSWKAKVVAADLGTDVAVLRIKRKLPVLAADCGGSPALVGDRVHSYGSERTGKRNHTRVRSGRVSAFPAPEQIQSDQAFPPGGEGGPLVDRFGDAIGINARGAYGFDHTGELERRPLSLAVDLDSALEAAGLAKCPDGEARPAADQPETEDGTLSRAQLAELAAPATFVVESLEGGSGSGFGIHTDGSATWIATNHHVTVGSGLLTRPAVVVRQGSQRWVADVVASDKKSDTALLRVDAPLPVLPVNCNRDERPKKGEMVMAFGAPEDQWFQPDPTVVSLLRGFVSFAPWNKGAGYGVPHWAPDGVLEGTASFGKVLFVKKQRIRHTAAIHHGNSGGPLLNRQGEVIGINYRFGKKGELLAVNIDKLFHTLWRRGEIPKVCPPKAA